LNHFSHRLEWNQDRSFKKGEVYFVNFPPEPEKGSESSKLLQGPHRGVVLFDSTFPRKTVIVVPISSYVNSRGEKKPMIHTDVILLIEKYQQARKPYQGIIKVDSFMMTNQIRSISRNYLERYVGVILPEDMLKLQFQLIRTLDLTDAIEFLVQEKLQEILGEEYEEKEA
jgi:mRNA-degrading endonuclease toxin of MazEF toxin-antitoxin module